MKLFEDLLVLVLAARCHCNTETKNIHILLAVKALQCSDINLCFGNPMIQTDQSETSIAIQIISRLISIICMAIYKNNTRL